MLMLCHFTFVYTNACMIFPFRLAYFCVSFIRTTINSPVAKRNTVFYLLLFVIVSYSVWLGSVRFTSSSNWLNMESMSARPPRSPLPHTHLKIYVNQVQVECACLSVCVSVRYLWIWFSNNKLLPLFHLYICIVYVASSDLAFAVLFIIILHLLLSTILFHHKCTSLSHMVASGFWRFAKWVCFCNILRTITKLCDEFLCMSICAFFSGMKLNELWKLATIHTHQRCVQQ